MSATTFDVSVLLRLIDQMTGPGKKAAANFRGVSQSTTQSAAQRLDDILNEMIARLL